MSEKHFFINHIKYFTYGSLGKAGESGFIFLDNR